MGGRVGPTTRDLNRSVSVTLRQNWLISESTSTSDAILALTCTDFNCLSHTKLYFEKVGVNRWFCKGIFALDMLDSDGSVKVINEKMSNITTCPLLFKFKNRKEKIMNND